MLLLTRWGLCCRRSQAHEVGRCQVARAAAVMCASTVMLCSFLTHLVASAQHVHRLASMQGADETNMIAILNYRFIGARELPVAIVYEHQDAWPH